MTFTVSPHFKAQGFIQGGIRFLRVDFRDLPPLTAIATKASREAKQHSMCSNLYFHEVMTTWREQKSRWPKHVS